MLRPLPPTVGLMPLWALLLALPAQAQDDRGPILPDVPGVPTALVDRPGSNSAQAQPAWIVPAADGKRKEAVFLDGWRIPAPAKPAPYDLKADAEALTSGLLRPDDETDALDELLNEKPEDPKAKAWKQEHERLERITESGLSPALFAALLARCGQADLARRLQAAVDGLGRQGQARYLVRQANGTAYGPEVALERFAKCWNDGARAEADHHLGALRRRWPAELAAQEWWPAVEREQLRRAMVAAAPRPAVDEAALAKGPAEAAFAEALARLDEAQGDEPAGWMRQAVRRMDLAALPALAAHMRSDTRLTRHLEVSSQWDYDPETRSQFRKTEIRARTAAEIAAKLALQAAGTPIFEQPDDANDGIDLPAAAGLVEAYHAKVQGRSLSQRRLAFLQDERADPWERLEVLGKLVGESKAPEKLAAELPGLEQAVLKLEEGWLANARGAGNLLQYLDQDQINSNGIGAIGLRALARKLVPLKLPACAAPLRNEWQAEGDASERLALALALHELGDGGALAQTARDLGAGALLPAEDPNNRTPWSSSPAMALIQRLAAESDLHPALGEALGRITAADHPLHPDVAALLTRPARFGQLDPALHPALLVLLAGQLESASPTNCKWTDGEGEITLHFRWRNNNWDWEEEPQGELHDAKLRRPEADETVADVAAMKLGAACAGCPQAHPLFKDQARRVDAARDYARRFLQAPARLRRAVGPEQALQRPWLPDLRPQGRPATEADVQAGRAVFALGEGAKADAMKLPAAGVLKARAEARAAFAKEHPDEQDPAPPAEVLVVQAERDADGTLWLGLIEQGDIRKVKAEEVKDLKPYDPDKFKRAQAGGDGGERGPRNLPAGIQLQQLRLRGQIHFAEVEVCE